METTFIVCIGNKARGDDGVARRVAELLEGRLPEHIGLLSAPQLDIVLTERVAEADRVVFVDAERRPGPPAQWATLEPSAAKSNAHALDPAGLLALVQVLYAARPEALLLSLAAPEMGHGEGLSPVAEESALSGVVEIERLIGA